MKALLVRIGIDQSYGGWNAPVNADGRFVYVPIPEKRGTAFHQGLERRYVEVLPALERFCGEHGCNLTADLAFPGTLLELPMHLDPDFECLTYGDVGDRRGAGMVDMRDGDLLVFYSGLRPIYASTQRLIYALVGMYIVEEVLPAATLPRERWHENAHVRKIQRGKSDIVVRARPGVSGRFDRCIPIGEWRASAYRVRRNLIKAWGGLSVKDGFIQRSAVPPVFKRPERFVAWLEKHDIQLLAGNN